VDDALDETLTAAQNAERRTLWTRQQVLEMLRLQRRDDAAAIRSQASIMHHTSSRLLLERTADEIDPEAAL
jgi:hypothetical protein